MAPCTEVRALRDAAVCGDRHFGKVIDPNVLAEPRMFSDCKPPRKLDACAGLNDDALAYFGAKKPKKPSAMN